MQGNIFSKKHFTKIQKEDHRALLKMAEAMGTKPATLARNIIHANLAYAAR